MKKLLAVLILISAANDLQAVSLPRTILILPFENKSTRADLKWVSYSFSETLSLCLAGDERFVLGRRERDAAYAQMGIPAGTPLTLASIYKVAETLGVDWVLTGDFNVENDGLTARGRILDVHRLRLSPPIEVVGQLAELLDLETRLAWRLLATHDPEFTVGKEEDFRRLFPETRLDAHENYIRGILATDADSQARFFQEADRLNAADRRAALELGRHFFDEKDYKNSARWLRKLDSADPNYNEALFMLGVDEFFLGHDLTAEKEFTVLAAQIPLNEVWNNLGFLQARRGHLEEATASLDRAYRGDPTDPIFCFNLGSILWQRKDFQDAVRYLSIAVQLAPEDTDGHRLLGEALGATGDMAGKRRERLWLAAQDESANGDSGPEVLPNLRLKKNYDGRAYRLLSLAIRNALEERLQREPAARHAEAHMIRGKEMLAAGRLLEAKREFAEASSLLPQDHKAHIALAQVYEARGLHREAAAELETSLELRNTAVAHLFLARVYLALDQRAAARDHGRAALDLDPANAQAQALLDQIAALPAPPGEKP